MSRILIIDPQPSASADTEFILARVGHECHVCRDGEQAIRYLSQQTVDLVISEINLPLLKGRTFIQRASARFSMPILVLTAQLNGQQRTQAYRAGADMCLTKQSGADELLAAVYAMLRRVNIEQQRQHVASENEQLNQSLKRLPLTSTESELLSYLSQRAGQAVSKLELQQQVLQREYSPLDRNLDVHISNIRKKIIKTGLNLAPIRTVRGVGYCFEMPEKDPIAKIVN